MCHVSPKLSFNYQLRYLSFYFHPLYFIFLVYMLEANSCIAACYLLRQVWLVALLDLHTALSRSSLCLKPWDSSFSRSRVDLRLHLHDWCIEYVHIECAYCWRPFTICTAITMQLLGIWYCTISEDLTMMDKPFHWHQHTKYEQCINNWHRYRITVKNSLQHTNPDSAHTSNSSNSKTADQFINND